MGWLLTSKCHSCILCALGAGRSALLEQFSGQPSPTWSLLLVVAVLRRHCCCVYVVVRSQLPFSREKKNAIKKKYQWQGFETRRVSNTYLSPPNEQSGLRGSIKNAPVPVMYEWSENSGSSSGCSTRKPFTWFRSCVAEWKNSASAEVWFPYFVKASAYILVIVGWDGLWGLNAQFCSTIQFISANQVDRMDYQYLCPK